MMDSDEDADWSVGEEPRPPADERMVDADIENLVEVGSFTLH